MKLLSITAVIVVLMFSFSDIYSQTSSIFDKLEYTTNTSGKVRVVQDDAIKLLVEKHQWAKSKSKGIIGYRIRIFSDSGPSAKAGYDRAMAQFSYLFGDVPIYEKFVYPDYKIYVGDFRTESEALNFRKEIEYKFTGAFLIRTKINFPKLDLNE